MNKIVVKTKELKLENSDILITDLQEQDIIFHVYGKVSCGIKKIPNTSSITIYLHESAHLMLEFFLQMENTSSTITIYNEAHSSLDLHYSCSFTKKNVLKIYNFVKERNTKNTILVRAIEENGSLEVRAEGCIEEETVNSVYLEDVKAIMSHLNHIEIEPNLLVKTDSVIANHNATISNISKKELFYLKSRGICKENATNLIKTGFLKSILEIKELKMGGDEE